MMASYDREREFYRLIIRIAIGILFFVIILFVTTYNFLAASSKAKKEFMILMDPLSSKITIGQIEKQGNLLAGWPNTENKKDQQNHFPRISEKYPGCLEFLADLDGQKAAKIMHEKIKLKFKKTTWIIWGWLLILSYITLPTLFFAYGVKLFFRKKRWKRLDEKNTMDSRKMKREAESFLEEAQIIRKQAQKLREDTDMEKMDYLRKKASLEDDLGKEYEEKEIKLNEKHRKEIKKIEEKYKNLLQEKNKIIDELKNNIHAIKALADKW